MATRKRVNKKKPKKARIRQRRTTNEIPLTKLDAHYIEMKMVFDAAKKAGFDEANALRISYDRESYPDWIVPADDPIKKIGWEDGEEDN